MEKNTVFAIVFSMLFLIIWWTFFQSPTAQKPATTVPTAQQQTQQQPQAAATPVAPALTAAPQDSTLPEREIAVETANSRVIFTNRGAAVKHWYIKEKNGTLTDLVLPEAAPVLANFPGSNYTVTQPDARTIVFSHVSPQGWQATKTYTLSDDYLHTVSLDIKALKSGAALPPVELSWGPGLGTDQKEEKENYSVTRALGFSDGKPKKLQKFKPGDYPASGLQWVAVDNRYFLAALIPSEPAEFGTVSVYKANKKGPAGITLVSTKQAQTTPASYSFKLYLGPKGLDHLKSLQLNLEETVDFGFFGFLGKIALAVLLFLYKLTGNYGWAIIILTLIIQVLVAPLTLKSFEASAAMKRLQPKLKELQDKYKDNPQRLNVEMLNMYKSNKVNPLGGCLPLLLQLPIFWALFTTLRNAYELRGAHWLLWVKDLSAPDTLTYIAGLPINVLPLIMGIGMFFQQKMMSVATDPTQKSMMYLMPVIFTFMFWGFPSGLVIYWLTNSIFSMVEQYIILNRQQTEVA
jgi:YidC/Oxa1 family membrane protein insertase